MIINNTIINQDQNAYKSLHAKIFQVTIVLGRDLNLEDFYSFHLEILYLSYHNDLRIHYQIQT